MRGVDVYLCGKSEEYCIHSYQESLYRDDGIYQTGQERHHLEELLSACQCSACQRDVLSSVVSQLQERTSQLQQALNYEAILKRITDKVRDSLSEEQILQTVVKELRSIPGVNRCAESLYNLDQETLTIRYDSSTPSAQGCTLSITEIPGFQQLSSGHSLQFCPTSLNSTDLEQNQAILTCPVFNEQQMLGSLWLFKRSEDSFSELEVRLVKQVANQCAIAIRQARLDRVAQTKIDELEKLHQLKNDFLSTISHELRTPLSSIKMGVRMLELTLSRQKMSDLAERTAQTSKVDQLLKVVNDECEQIINLVNHLLTLQQLEAGTHPLLPTKIRLQDWIPHFVETFEEEAQKRHQCLQVNIPADLPPLVCDLSIFSCILGELLTNASKFTPDEEHITVKAQTQAGMMQLSVINSGVEISNSEFPHIFEKFYRVPSSDPWKHGGTGLGLALVQKLATYLGGAIWVESNCNQTCLTVELPIQDWSSTPTNIDLLMGYVAYYISRGKTVVSPLGGKLPFSGTVYQYWGYHCDFLSFWKQLQHRHDFRNLYLEGDVNEFGDFLGGSCSVGECARCCLPISMAEGSAYSRPNCNLCNRNLVAQDELSPTHVIAIGTLPNDCKNLQKLFALNGFEVVFVSSPEEITPQSLPDTVDMVLLHGQVSEADGKAIANSLRLYPQLQQVPFVALSSKSRHSHPWLERTLGLEDYLLVPLNGEHLARHLRQATQANSSFTGVEPYWFPC